MINSKQRGHHINPVFKMLLLLFVLCLWPWPVLPQEGPCEKRQLPVFVTDKDGHLVTTLTSADFIVEGGGAPMSVVAWNNDARQHRVVILLDVSPSMRGVGPRLWPVAMALARHASHAAGENNQLALVLFADRVLGKVGFSQGRAAVQRTLVDVTGDPAFPVAGKGNDSRIYDVLKEGSRLLQNATSADSLLVITDGLDEGSESKPDEILNLLSNSMIRVFAILVDPFAGKQWSLELQGQRSAFKRLVEKSGGKIFGPIDATQFRDSAKTVDTRKAMDERLEQFYGGIFANDVLTIQAPSDIQKPEDIRLFLTDSARHQLKKPQIFFPHEIGACSSVQPSQ